MPSVSLSTKNYETLSFPSEMLGRSLSIDFYLPPNRNEPNIDVLLINDGQDLRTMNFGSIMSELYRKEVIRPVICVAIHAGPQRKFEYGTAISPDFKGRGNLARNYTAFITDELIPAIHQLFPQILNRRWAYAGFSLGALSALDICWNNGRFFNTVAVFSGSLWWRTLDKDDPDYKDEQHRIMHNQIRDREKVSGMRFYFECGSEDEIEDRNGNGVIDSIDDTLDLMETLANKGYDRGNEMYYHEILGGKHDIATWAIAFPVFLTWAYKA